MKYKYWYISLVFIFINFFFPKIVDAQEGRPYLIIQYMDDEILELKLSNDFSIDHQSGVLEINTAQPTTNQIIPLNTISLIGFIYKNTGDDDTGLESLFDDQTKGLWQIYDIDGKLIRETDSNVPDLKNLPPGKIFIIKNGSSSFKYIPYK